MKRLIMLLTVVFAFVFLAYGTDPVKKVEKDVKQTASDVGKAGKAAAEKGKEALTTAAVATTKTAAAVEKGTEKAGRSLWENIKEFGRRVKNLFSK
jgi:hypothetical protein